MTLPESDYDDVDILLELSLPDVGESTWLDVKYMPWGCSDIIALEKDGSETPMCSCDFFWRSDDRKPVMFRFDNSLDMDEE